MPTTKYLETEPREFKISSCKEFGSFSKKNGKVEVCSGDYNYLETWVLYSSDPERTFYKEVLDYSLPFIAENIERGSDKYEGHVNVALNRVFLDNYIKTNLLDCSSKERTPAEYIISGIDHGYTSTWGKSLKEYLEASEPILIPVDTFSPNVLASLQDLGLFMI